MDKDLQNIIDGKGLENADLYNCESIGIREEDKGWSFSVEDTQTALTADNIVIADESGNYPDFKDTESITVSSSSTVGSETIDLKLWVKMLKRQRRRIRWMRIKHFFRGHEYKEEDAFTKEYLKLILEYCKGV
jgi:hypothetical protein